MLGGSVCWTGRSKLSPMAMGTKTLPMHKTVILQCMLPFEPIGRRFCDWPGSMGPTTFDPSGPRLAGFRDVLLHNYMGLDLRIVV